MERNPYAPPQAQVADAPLTDTRARPREVTNAVNLMWISLALGVVGNAFDWSHQTARLSPITLITMSLVGLAIGVWFIRALARGRNWVRVLFLIGMGFALLGFMSAIWLPPIRAAYIEAYAHSAAVGSLRGIQFILHAIAIGLLFTRPANRWFRPAQV